MNWVNWSEYTDKQGEKLVRIGPSHYTIPVAFKIAKELNELLKDLYLCEQCGWEMITVQGCCIEGCCTESICTNDDCETNK